jgi:hypothetical protein
MITLLTLSSMLSTKFDSVISRLPERACGIDCPASGPRYRSDLPVSLPLLNAFPWLVGGLPRLLGPAIHHVKVDFTAAKLEPCTTAHPGPPKHRLQARFIEQHYRGRAFLAQI